MKKITSNHKILSVIAYCLIIFFGQQSAYATTNEAPQPPPMSVKPLKMMARLQELVGQWELQTLYTADAGKNWQDMGTITVDVGYDQKQLMLYERPVIAKKTGFNMVSYLTYDQYRNVYRKAAIDDVWGIMDLYTGEIKDGELIMTNLEHGTLFPEPNGGARGFRLSLELQGDERSMTIEATLDNGKSWFPNFKNIYRRISEN